MATRTAISVKPLTTTVGAVVEGIDMRHSQDAGDVAAIREALLRHGVLFFREQDVTREEFWEFSKYFGVPLSEESTGSPADTAEKLMSADMTATRNSTAVWHADTTSLARPPWGALLRSVTMPDFGGDTCFLNVQAAYEALSEPVRAMLDGLTAVHHVDALLERMGEHGQRFGDIFTSLHSPSQEHPLVLTHPENGRKGIYVNEAFTTRIVELSPPESSAVLQMLFRHMQTPHFTMRWKWQPGDVAFWDNRSTQHFAVPDYTGGRVMQRIVLDGVRPGS